MKALDLFCCAGGASYGLAQNGFDVTGIDIDPQPHYPFKFVQMNVLDLDVTYLSDFDYVFASPPCQGYSTTASLHGKEYPKLIGRVRELLDKSGKFYTIENVVGSELVNPVMLCGSMFGLRMYRHRLFESNFLVPQPFHPKHITKVVRLGRTPKKDAFLSMCGHFSGVEEARQNTGHIWMNQHELAQCIPWKYSEYISKYHPMIRGNL